MKRFSMLHSLYFHMRLETFHFKLLDWMLPTTKLHFCLKISNTYSVAFAKDRWKHRGTYSLSVKLLTYSGQPCIIGWDPALNCQNSAPETFSMDSQKSKGRGVEKKQTDALNTLMVLTKIYMHNQVCLKPIMSFDGLKLFIQSTMKQKMSWLNPKVVTKIIQKWELVANKTATIIQKGRY